MDNSTLSLNDVQRIEGALLSAFDDFCSQNNLTYYLAYGTLLGAARHKGFIPWDDDTDVWMPRDDYEKLIKLTSSNFHILAPDSNESIWCFAKICAYGTAFQEPGVHHVDEYGVFIDVFPLDCQPKKNARKTFRKVKNAMIKYTWCFAYYDVPASSKVKLWTKRFLRSLWKIRPKQRWLLLIDNLAYREVDPSSSQKICYFSPYSFDKESLSADELEPATTLSFEGVECKVPRQWDVILRRLYGDWGIPIKRAAEVHGIASCRCGWNVDSVIERILQR